MKDELVADAIESGDDERIRAILQEVCEITGMGFAAVARVTTDRWIACQVVDRIAFGLPPGGELEVQKTICNEIREHAQAVVFDDAVDDPAWETHPVPIFYGFRSYASFPIVLPDGSFYGTLCAIDPEPRRVSSEAVIRTLRDRAAEIARLLADRRGADAGAPSLQQAS
jgi:GAF domain-containing protein